MFKFKTKPFVDIDAEGLRQALAGAEPPIVVDVRSPEEFGRGHIAGARLLPLPMLSLRHHELPQDKDIVLVCRSGARSRLSGETLAKFGFTRLYNLDQGILGWGSRGYELQK